MSHFQFALSVKCPKCYAGAGRWCREKGKCVPPHRERAKEALRLSCAVLTHLRFGSRSEVPNGD